MSLKLLNIRSYSNSKVTEEQGPDDRTLLIIHSGKLSRTVARKQGQLYNLVCHFSEPLFTRGRRVPVCVTQIYGIHRPSDLITFCVHKYQ